MKKAQNSLVLIFSTALIIFIPFQPLLQSIFGRYLTSGSAFWVAHWYEPVVVFLFAASILRLILRKYRADAIDWLSYALIALGVVSVIFLSPNIGRGLEGFRFTLFAVMIFAIVRNYQVPNKLISYYLITGAIVALWALVERVLPLGYWASIANSTFGWGNFSIVSDYQSSAVLAGPNQLGSYLIPALFIAINNAGKLKVKSEKLKVWNLYHIAYGLLLTAAIFFSFSRSAWVAVAATIIIAWVITLVMGDQYSKISKWVLGGISVVILTLLIYLTYHLASNQLITNDIITHGQSQSEHMNAIKDSISEIGNRFSQPVRLLIGSGLGTAGPAVLKYGNGEISESWYLQLALELGIVGLALWLVFIGFLINRLWRSEQIGLMLGLVGVSLAAIFLHTWADNPAIAITLFMLIGITINWENNTHRINT